jgi:PAS domain S-box-containing protein
MIEMILAAIPSILIGIEMDSTVTVWNRAAESIFGLPSESAVGRRINEVQVAWDSEAVRSLVEACLVGATIAKNDAIAFTRLDGRAGILGVTAIPLFGACAELIGVLFFASDRTERLAAERHLMQAQKLESIGQLAAGIAHEINTPTQYVSDNTRYLLQAYHKATPILMAFKELLEDGTMQDPRIQLGRELWTQNKMDAVLKSAPEAINESLEGLDRIATIVRAMKEFSHPGGVEKSPTDINHCIETTVAVARNEWKYVSKVELKLDPELPMVPCLAGEFNQVILNMLVNASHSIADRVGNSGEFGLITITTTRGVEEVRISVSDSGMGMAPAVRDRIFDPFFTTKEVGKGTGQGLALAHDVIVHRHGGQIHVESELGVGTTFILVVPLIASEEVKAA